jgi:hypothetical protein
MPGNDPARFREQRIGGCGATRKHVDDLVVKFQEGQVRLRNDQVLVVAMIANEGEPLRAARQIVAERAGRIGQFHVLADQKLGPGEAPALDPLRA